MALSTSMLEQFGFFPEDAVVDFACRCMASDLPLSPT
jgi:hypothetical protein